MGVGASETETETETAPATPSVPGDWSLTHSGWSIERRAHRIEGRQFQCPSVCGMIDPRSRILHSGFGRSSEWLE